MTQMITTPGLTTDEINAAWADTLATLVTIPTTGGEPSVITGAPTARYGALVRIDHEVRIGDRTGAWVLGAKRGLTFTAPEDASTVLSRMLDEGRVIYGLSGIRGALGGTTRI